MIPRLSLLLLLLSPLLAYAQFGFFDQMFNGGSGGRQREQQNVPSNSDWYNHNYEEATCNKYLCSGTLACVDKPTHCPCAFPKTEDKFELHPDGLAICLSKTGRKDTAARVAMARKGLM
ncbi:long chronological lifespan protein 2 [Tricharina praecox]|uniref:long chronological lifespan protein 2 n=1 Tax=Tricharina praecox TaxID=43433 RepID=UPI00221F0354|nr:long chronological lifespan protein 2 [Tricharina praecox]KAI5844166.1 long chronological lifespan protein 2 [Tricharina praecox]